MAAPTPGKRPLRRQWGLGPERKPPAYPPSSAHFSYDERISRVEKRIATRMRDQLGAATSADDMFRIFSRFSVLFSRPT
jgi:hypothetical protein